VLREPRDSAQAIVDPRDAAESARLRYVSDERPGIWRKKAGTGFSHARPDGSRLIEPGADARPCLPKLGLGVGKIVAGAAVVGGRRPARDVTVPGPCCLLDAAPIAFMMRPIAKPRQITA
jgi:hypothetical protein